MCLCSITSYFASDLIDAPVEEMVRDHVADVVTDAILNDICFVYEQVHAANSSAIKRIRGPWAKVPHRQ